MITENQKDDLVEVLLVIKKLGVEQEELTDLDIETLQRNYNLLKTIIGNYIKGN